MSLLPRGANERWSWQILVVALISQYPHLQYLTTIVFLIEPAKRVEIRSLLDWFPENHLCPSMHYCPTGAFPSAGSGYEPAHTDKTV